MGNAKKTASQKLTLAWKEFTSSGRTGMSTVPPDILASWERCYKFGVDPYDGSSHMVFNQLELEDLLLKKQELISVAKPFMRRLYDFIHDTYFAVFLTDEEGYIMENVSDFDVSEATDINIGSGVRWREEDVGTNAIGLALLLKKPIQTSGAEHYCITHHPATCSAAPIMGADGSIAGTLVIIGYLNDTHKHTLGMIVAAVDAIGDQLLIRKTNRELTIMNNRLTNILMNMSDGVIVTDNNGDIYQINPMVERILGKFNNEIIGYSINRFYDDRGAYSRDVLVNGKPYSEKEVTIKCMSHFHLSMASAHAIRDERDCIVGGVIILNPIEKMQKLIKRYASSPASFHLEDIIGNCQEIRKVVEIAARAAKSTSSVLLEGESGTGKEVFAQAIHNHSNRDKGPFVAVNCGALPRELIASELFGYTEGAFTGAKKEGKPGKFELANGGTVFLDEIGEMPLEQQVNLLRVLQERKVTRIGGEKEISIDVRVICATNKNLMKEVQKGNFRQDLYYRLNVISIQLPPLRERREDIPLIFAYLIGMSQPKFNLGNVNPEVIKCLKRYDWPGNIRELQNVVERMLSLADGNYLDIEHLPQDISDTLLGEIYDNDNSDPLPKQSIGNMRKHIKKEIMDKEYRKIISVLEQCGGNISLVARELGVDRCTVYRKMKRYNIDI